MLKLIIPGKGYAIDNQTIEDNFSKVQEYVNALESDFEEDIETLHKAVLNDSDIEEVKKSIEKLDELRVNLGNRLNALTIKVEKLPEDDKSFVVAIANLTERIAVLEKKGWFTRLIKKIF